MEISDLTLVGHPYAPIGMGEHIRCVDRAMRSVGLRPGLTDIYQLQQPDAAMEREFATRLRQRLGELNVFHINGDEVAQSLAHLAQRQAAEAYNIVYPAWELARYPDEWARQLDLFDEVWAPSRFIEGSLLNVCKRPVVYMPLACEVSLEKFLGRRYFGIPESDYTFLFFFDLRSYDTRKNCRAVVEAFRRLLAKRTACRARLVLKVNSGGHDPVALERLHSYTEGLGDRLVIIDQVMTDNEIKNLIRCCDCFVSLHRSEGYGRGMAEAMYLGKPVIATGYSGNVDFMPHDAALLVRYELIPVAAGAYPYWRDQVWADPDIEQASDYMIKLHDEPEQGRTLGERAARHIRIKFGYRAIGLRYRKRLDEIFDRRSMGTLAAGKGQGD